MSASIATDSPLTDSERQTLAAYAGALIPADADFDVPGADDPSIQADIVASARRHAEAVAAGLAFQDTVAEAAYGSAFAALSAAERAEFVTRANTPGGFDDVEWTPDPALVAGQRTLHAIILQCYYRDDRVMQSLGMAPRSPFPEGFDVEQGDWSLLEPVKQRGPIYRQV